MVLDLEPTSATFGEVAHRVPLEPMSTGPQPGDAIYEVNQYRAINVTPDGLLGFVTQGGDSIVTVFDSRTGEVTGGIETPSSLDGGGYLAVFGAPDSFMEPIAR